MGTHQASHHAWESTIPKSTLSPSCFNAPHPPPSPHLCTTGLFQPLALYPNARAFHTQPPLSTAVFSHPVQPVGNPPPKPPTLRTSPKFQNSSLLISRTGLPLNRLLPNPFLNISTFPPSSTGTTIFSIPLSCSFPLHPLRCLNLQQPPLPFPSSVA